MNSVAIRPLLVKLKLAQTLYINDHLSFETELYRSLSAEKRNNLRQFLKQGKPTMNSLDAAFNFHETALRLRAQRQELLASNVANADTPNYKARDFDFAAALKQATTNSATNTAAPIASATTNPAHIAFSQSNNDPFSSGPKILYRASVQDSLDGNTVDVDVERNQFTDNAIRYQASLNMVSGDIKDLLSIIQNNG
jgi:flagellar basal-body rod protein FlgB